MRKLSVVAPILSALLKTAASPGPPCAACTCVRDPDQPLEDAVPEAYEAAPAVFSGRVIRERPVTLDEARAGVDAFDFRYDVVVERSWKGPPARDTVTISTSGQSSMCGADLRPGHRYLIYANARTGGGLGASSCSRTARLSSVDPGELRLLGRLRSSPPASTAAAAGS